MRLRINLFLLFSFVLMIFPAPSRAVPDDLEKIILGGDGILEYMPSGDVFLLQAGVHLISSGEGWERKQVTPFIYQFRKKGWTDAFWQFDLKAREFRVARGKPFGTPVAGDKAGVVERAFIRTFSSGGANEPPMKFSSNLNLLEIIIDVKSESAGVFMDGLPVATPDELEATRLNGSVWQVRLKGWKDSFLEVDIKERKTYVASFSTFGSPSKTRMPATLMVDLADGEGDRETNFPEYKRDLLMDSGFAGLTSVPKNSPWTESEKKTYTELLKNASFDALVVPVQVSGYAFDRVNRSLMMRYFSKALEARAGLKLPDPTFVERALGQGMRSFSDEDIYRLADALKVKVLVRLHAGHFMQENMLLTVIVQTRNKKGILGPNTKAVRLDWKDVPFSDERPPAEAFRELLNEIVPKLPLKTAEEPKAAYYEKAKIKIPDYKELPGRHASPVVDAYYLQLLGMLMPQDAEMLYPDDEPEREPFFERSLVALTQVSPKSPDYALLRSRAFFNLGSRPAALEALGAPKTAEEKAFLAYLNGNVPEMRKWMDKIDHPFHRLFSELELIDLRMTYNRPDIQETEMKRLAGLAPGWELLVIRRVMGKDHWAGLPSIFFKKMMDALYPIPNFTAEGLAEANLAQGEFPDSEEIDFSLNEHRKRILSENGKKYAGLNGSSRPIETDCLDLLYGAGESSLWKNVKKLVFVQGLYESAIEWLDKYEAVYLGHPRLMYLKIVAMRGLMNKAREGRHYAERIKALEKDLCYWSQGQNGINSCTSETFYNNDYPKHINAAGEDRRQLKKPAVKSLARFNTDFIKNHELNLLYTNRDFQLFEAYYESLLQSNAMKSDAGELLKISKERFVGNPKRTNYFAKKAVEERDYAGAEALYKEAIALVPEHWSAYESLGELHMSRGEKDKAYGVLKEYPQFKTGEGNRVGLSNNAYNAGYLFLRSGYIKEARHFLKFSAESDTGAGSEMLSTIHLALLDNDFRAAAASYLDLYKRYDDHKGSSRYITMLDITGNRREARALLDSADMRNREGFIDTALISMRMDGLAEGEQEKRLFKETFHKPAANDGVYFMILGNFLDRTPDPKLMENMEKVRSLPDFHEYKIREFRNFAEGYLNIRLKRYDNAFSLYKGLGKQMPGWMMPYMAVSAAKTGNLPEVEKRLEDYNNKGHYFNYYLARAFINGSRGRHGEAIKDLTLARNNMDYLSNPPVPQWYRVIEFSEWLYEDTGNAAYRDFAVELAKTYQKIMPMYAWAFAVEAKYAKTEAERLKPLAMTLYLDRRSERISKIPEKEKEMALKWLDKNNPFLKAQKVSSGGL